MLNTIEMYNGKVWGKDVSDYGLENGYLDYLTLAEMVGHRILGNALRSETIEDWYIVNGTYDKEIFQFYIISESGYEVLKEFTDEIVFYSEKFELYLWGITHFGTSWDYVLTDVKLVEDEKTS